MTKPMSATRSMEITREMILQFEEAMTNGYTRKEAMRIAADVLKRATAPPLNSGRYANARV